MNHSVQNPLFTLIQTFIITNHTNTKNNGITRFLKKCIHFPYACSFSNKILHNTVGPNSLAQVKMQGPYKPVTLSSQALRTCVKASPEVRFSKGGSQTPTTPWAFVLSSVTQQCRPKANMLFLFVMVSSPNAF